MLDLIQEFARHRLRSRRGDPYAREEFIAARMVSAKHTNDAIHIASAVVRNADVLLSWNFRHIVKLQTRRLVIATSMVAGYKADRDMHSGGSHP